MKSLSHTHQSKKEEYDKNYKAKTIYRVITNTPKSRVSDLLEESPNTDVIEKLQKNKMYMLSIDDYDLICKNKMVKRMIAAALDTEISKLTTICKYMHIFKQHIDLSPKAIKEKMKAKALPIKDLDPELFSGMKIKGMTGMTSMTGMTIRDLPEHLIERIIHDDLKPLFKYVLRDGIPFHKIDLKALSENPNAIDFLSLKINNKYINYATLSKNTNPKALELIKAELMVNPNNPDIDWYALSENPEAIDILDAYRGKIKLSNLSKNTSPRAIELIKEALMVNQNNPDIDWDALSGNTSNEAIEFLSSPENYRKINWEELSSNTNPKAIELLKNKAIEENTLLKEALQKYNRLKPNQKINWRELSRNPKAISLLENKWEEEKKLTSYNENGKRFDMKQYNKLKKCGYIIDWTSLCSNPNAIDLLRMKIKEENDLSEGEYASLEPIEKINWWVLSANPEAIQLLEANWTKINWSQLGTNSKAIKLLEKELLDNPQNIIWYSLSGNPEAISILDKNKDKIIWSQLSENPNAGELLKDRVVYEDRLTKKQYNEIANFHKLQMGKFSRNPSIFTLA